MNKKRRVTAKDIGRRPGLIVSKVSTDEYRKNYDRIFKKEKDNG